MELICIKKSGYSVVKPGTEGLASLTPNPVFEILVLTVVLFSFCSENTVRVLGNKLFLLLVQ